MATRSPSLDVHDRIEVNVYSSLDAIEHLSGRIERAYLRRNPRWSVLVLGRDRAVWDSAASRLLGASSRCPDLPVDPELFVAILAPGRVAPDPWAELTQRGAQTRYLKAVRRIINRLRRELESELRLAEGRINKGMTLDELLDLEEERISPLTRFILAYRAGRYDLVLKHIAAAQAQHRSCSLYREASRTLLPDRAYPGPGSEADTHFVGRESVQFSLN